MGGLPGLAAKLNLDKSISKTAFASPKSENCVNGKFEERNPKPESQGSIFI
jgi:hypothetical protein